MRRHPLGSTGMEVSEIGFGASPLGAVYGVFPEADGIATVRTALDHGINFFDVSPYYGATRAEAVLGKALRGFDRSSYVLATKVGRYGDRDFDFTAERVTRSVRESLERLGTDHLDLVQCHDIEFGDPEQIVHEAVPALYALRDAGLVRAVGVTGYPLAVLAEVAEQVALDTVMSYCQYTLQNRRLGEWHGRFDAHGCAVVNAAPLAMGALTRRGPAPWHPAGPEVLARCSAAAALCDSRGQDIARLAVQFSVSAGGFPSTVVGFGGPDEVRRVVDWIGRPIDGELLRAVDDILAPVRDVEWESGRPRGRAMTGEAHD